MLNKELCFKCWKSNFDPIPTWALDNFECYWKLKGVFCDGKWLGTDKKPPEKCPYFLEYVLQEQKSC